MKLPTAPRAILIATIGLLMTGPTAVAQGTRGVLPDPLSSAALQAGAAEVGLTEAQLPGAFAALERYLAEWKVLRDAEVAKFLAEWDSRDADASAAVQEAFADRRRGLFTRMLGLDATLVADLTALVEPGQRPAVARLGEKWRRRAAFAIVSNGRGSAELSEVATAAELTPELRQQIDLALIAWEANATPALERAARLQIDSLAVLAKARESQPQLANAADFMQHLTAVREYMDQANAELNKATRNLRRQYREAVDQMRTMLPRTQSIRLLGEAIEQCYGMLPDGGQERSFLEHVHGVTQTPEQTKAISALENSWWNTFETTISECMDAADERPSQGDMFMFEIGGKDAALRNEQTERLDKLSAASSEMRRSIEQLLGIDWQAITAARAEQPAAAGTEIVLSGASMPVVATVAIETTAGLEAGEWVGAVGGQVVSLAVGSSAAVEISGGGFTFNADGLGLDGITIGMSDDSGDQFAGSFGPPGAIPLITDTVLADQLAQLGASEDAQAIGRALYEEYRAEGEKANAVAESLRNPGESGPASLKASQVEPFFTARQTAFDQIMTLEQHLYGDISTAAMSDADSPVRLQWQGANRRRELLRLGSAEPIRAGLAAVDLTTAAAAAGLSEADRVQADRILSGYSEALENALRQRDLLVSQALRAITAADARIHEQWQQVRGDQADANVQVAMSMDDGEMRSRWEADRKRAKANDALSQFNIAELAELDAGLSPEGRAAMQMAWGRQAYPGVFNDPRRISAAFDVARAAAGSSTEAINAIRAQYEQSYSDLMRQMVETRHNAAVQTSGADSGIIIISTALPSGKGAEALAPHVVHQQMNARLTQLRFERDELTDATWRRLTEAVGPEVAAALPPPPERTKKTR